MLGDIFEENGPYLVSSGIWPKFELIQALLYVLVTFKYEKDRIKKAEKTWRHRFHHYKSMGIFF